MAPPSQPIIRRIWHHLNNFYKNYNMHPHFVFCYSHCGVEENEAADTLASSLIHDANLTTLPACLRDTKTLVTTRTKTAAHELLSPSQHRQELHLPRHHQTTHCAITNKRLARAEQITLARARCGHATTFGWFYHSTRQTPNNCRWCTTQPANAPAPPQDNANNNDPQPPARLQCFHCTNVARDFATLATLKKHYTTAHVGQHPPQISTVCPHCGNNYKNLRAKARHMPYCKLAPANPTPVPIPAQLPPPTPLTPETLHHLLHCPGTLASREDSGVAAAMANVGLPTICYTAVLAAWLTSLQQPPPTPTL